MKITLANLAQATAQQVFDQVAKHLLTQKVRSTNGEWDCRYRSDLGLMCAAGCLIDDSEYSFELEDTSWGNLVRDCMVPPNHNGLIRCLQNIHDGDPPEEWRRQLSAASRKHRLKWNFGDTE